MICTKVLKGVSHSAPADIFLTSQQTLIYLDRCKGKAQFIKTQDKVRFNVLTRVALRLKKFWKKINVMKSSWQQAKHAKLYSDLLSENV